MVTAKKATIGKAKTAIDRRVRSARARARTAKYQVDGAAKARAGTR